MQARAGFATCRCRIGQRRTFGAMVHKQIEPGDGRDRYCACLYYPMLVMLCDGCSRYCHTGRNCAFLHPASSCLRWLLPLSSYPPCVYYRCHRRHSSRDMPAHVCVAVAAVVHAVLIVVVIAWAAIAITPSGTQFRLARLHLLQIITVRDAVNVFAKLSQPTRELAGVQRGRQECMSWVARVVSSSYALVC